MQSGPNSFKKPVFFYVLIKSWNTFNYSTRCIDSVLNQKYSNYKILFVDDASRFSKSQKDLIKQKLKDHICLFNKVRKYAVYNNYRMIHGYAGLKNSVVIILDGDDWLIRKDALKIISEAYSRRTNSPLLTYGSCILWNRNKKTKKSTEFNFPLSNTVYPKVVVKKSIYRQVPFRVFHPMTFRTSLFKKINEKDFKEDDGSWLKYCPDLASFLPMLEMANGRYLVLKEKFYAYNVVTSKSNLKKNLYNFQREPIIIRKKQRYEPIR